ncbi:hypothetical protein H3221_015045 [Pseudomonas sp. LMG 31766]|uniref:Uncharacterized protein n=1 Tax=Pseudomonas chaetocerotis TaxID=2758695 RepID=A0A931D3H0_9PSED|nr:hypothetical protein [Pseudomonas chaetocerotis]MBZ9666068.1 hypothetical protein [Pseudomonas chaetocerotis]
MTEAEVNMVDSTGPEIPAAAARALVRIQNIDAQSESFPLGDLRDDLNETLWHGHELGSPGADEQNLQRLSAKDWALQEFAFITPGSLQGFYRLQIALTTLAISSASDAEALAAVTQEMVSQPLLDGLESILGATDLDTQGGYGGRDYPQSRQEAQTLCRGHQYRLLESLIRHQPIFLTSEVRLAVLLLRRFAPQRLARFIEKKQDIFFSIGTRDVLAADAAGFALSVSDLSFKFICAASLADIEEASAPYGSVEDLYHLLLQVAKTDHWRAWISGLVHYPHVGAVAEKALPKALAELGAVHWADFLDAIELWTYAGTVQPVANILNAFQDALKDGASSEMWRLAFLRWDKWDYGQDEGKHLHAPAVCSFDYPVAMYYACLPLEEAQSERERLLEGIANVEQKWFTDVSALITYRNCLSSRLRLVQHGLSIRSRLATTALPPAIEPESEFLAVRYRYFDVNNPSKRGR